MYGGVVLRLKIRKMISSKNAIIQPQIHCGNLAVTSPDFGSELHGLYFSLLAFITVYSLLLVLTVSISFLSFTVKT